MIDGEKYAKFEEDIEASKTYGTIGDSGVNAPQSDHADNVPYQDNYYATDNKFQESSFTVYPNQQVSMITDKEMWKVL